MCVCMCVCVGGGGGGGGGVYGVFLCVWHLSKSGFVFAGECVCSGGMKKWMF